MKTIISAVALTAILTTPTQAAPKAAKSKPPVLTCSITTPEGLSFTAIKAGNGEKPSTDSKVKVNYKGFLQSDGTEFDAGTGAEFKVSGVIAGFGQGLQLMQPGAKYRLCIPSKLGYGEAGTGPIPANADLVFEVELLAFTNPPPKPVIPVAERSCSKTTASGLGYAELMPGAGKTPTEADMALLDFTTFDAKTGVVSEKREWEKIALAQAAPAFSEALQMMRVGGTSIFCLPDQKGQDAWAANPMPQMNIRVDLIDVRPAPVAE